MTEHEFYEQVATESHVPNPYDTDPDYVGCVYCVRKAIRKDGESYKLTAQHIEHDPDCPVLYARQRLEELQAEEADYKYDEWC